MVTRFPPEPNGFLHIGHAKSILLNFGLAQAYGGRTHLRFDDTNPVTEETEYVEAIQADVRWLGCDWGEHLHYASDYFERMYECAERLVREGKAYVDEQAQDADPRAARQLRAAGRERPVPRPARGGEPRPPPAHARGRVPGRRVRAARADRHGAPERAHARSAAVPDPPRAPPPHRRPLVHLPDVRLRASARGRVRGRDALDLHARVRVEPRAVRLGARRPRPVGPAAAPVRVRAARARLHGDVEAQAPPARQREAGLGLGRPAHADHRRAAPPRRHAGGAARLRRAHRRGEEQQRRRHRQARVRDPRRPRAAHAARARGARTPLPLVVESWPADRIEELEVPWWPGEPARGGSRKVPFGRELAHRARRLRGGAAVGLEAARARARGAARRRVRRPLRGGGARRSGRGQRGPLHARSAPRSAAASGGSVAGTIHWVHATRSAPAEVRLYDRLFRGRAAGRGARLPRRAQPALARRRGGRAGRAGARRGRAGHPLAVPAPGLLLRRPGRLAAGRAGVQPDHHAQGHVGAAARSRARPAAPARRTRARRRRARRPPARRRRAPRPGRSRAELRARGSAPRNPELAARFARYTGPLALAEDDADLLVRRRVARGVLRRRGRGPPERALRGALAPERPRRRSRATARSTRSRSRPPTSAASSRSSTRAGSRPRREDAPRRARGAAAATPRSA